MLRLIGVALRAQDDLQRTRFDGGIRIGSCFLGRQPLLPEIVAATGCHVAATPLRVELGDVSPVPSPASSSRYSLQSTPVASGRWRIEISEVGCESRSELSLTLVDRALEHEVITCPDPATDPRWLGEHEVATIPGRLVTKSLPSQGITSLPQLMDDLLEGLYAGGRSGWSETELLPLIRRLVGGEVSPWDSLRLLHEGGWVVPLLASGWGVRRWFLRPAFLETYNASTVSLRGAACATIRQRFLEEAARLGAVTTISGTHDALSVPTILATCCEWQELAANLGLHWVPAERQDTLAAPFCWAPCEPRTDRRVLASTWSWTENVFAARVEEPSKGVVLERWRKERGDARDLYVIRGGGETIGLMSRVAAILEAHRRRGWPLFEHRGGYLVRQARDGYLPAPMARALRLRHPRGSEIVAAPDGRGFLFRYQCDREDLGWLAQRLGRAIKSDQDDSRLVSTIFRRKLGARGGASMILQRGRGGN